MNPAAASTMWFSAMVDGWVDLAELTCLDHLDRPECIIARCGARARWVDPSGAGLCAVHAARRVPGQGPPARRP